MKGNFTTITSLLAFFSVLALTTPASAGKKVKLKSNSVASKHIRDGNVTASKIAPGAVGTTQIQNGAVSAAKLSSEIAVWANSGGSTTTSANVGIGETNPTQGKLVVSGTGDVENFTYWIYQSTGDAGPITADGDRSIYASGNIASFAYLAFSDERIKEISHISDSSLDLSTLLDIEITDYSYIDKIAKGDKSQKKVIAQQVEKVFPQAVGRSTDVVPDIYEKAHLDNGWITLETDLHIGDRVRLIGEKESGIHEVLETRDGAFRTAFQQENENVFVYGREVDDFRTVDYEAIAMLNVSATQELYRKNVALEQKVAALEAENQLRDAKLTAIEKMLEGNGANFASLKTVASAE